MQEGRYKVRSFLRSFLRSVIHSFVRSFVPLACASQPRGRFRLVAKSSLLCVGCFGNRSADCWRCSLVGCGCASSAIDDDDDYCATRHLMQELLFFSLFFWAGSLPKREK
jgi:hypothetical protein